VWALAIWAALRLVPASRAFAFSRFCFVVSFFDLLVWFDVAYLEDLRNSLARAFRVNDVTAEEKRRETDDHKTPDHDHIPIQVTGSLWARVALTFALDWASLRFLGHSTRFPEQIRRDLLAVV
jgi:hypothetical protein